MSQSITTESPNVSDQNLKNMFAKLQKALLTHIFNTGGLAIKAGGSAVAKTVNTVYGMINGALVSKAAADMAALSGTVTNAKFNVFCFFVNAAGTLSTAMGTEGDTLAEVVFPSRAADPTYAMIGFVIINPTGTGNFVGGTTPLDDATVVPNAVYVNTTFPNGHISETL